MFSVLRTELDERFLVVTQSLSAVGRMEKEGSFPPEVARAYKGLAFVQMYAAYEHCVTSAVQASLRAVNAGSFAHRDLRHSLLPLVLDDLCRSLADCGSAKTWGVRLKLMEMSRSPMAAQVSDTLFPADGTHYRAGQLETIWALFGVPEPHVPESRFIGRLDELVELRNAIAHGRMRPEDVGGRFSIADLETRHDDVRALCLHIMQVLENHVSDRARLLA